MISAIPEMVFSTLEKNLQQIENSICSCLMYCRMCSTPVRPPKAVFSIPLLFMHIGLLDGDYIIQGIATDITGQIQARRDINQ